MYRPLPGIPSNLSHYINRLPDARTVLTWAIALVSIAISLSCMSLPSFAQKPDAPKAKPAVANEKNDEKSTVEPGVVVEEVEAGREGDKAGLKVGDVILSWSRGDAAGKIESPFDFMWLKIEQRPRGMVTVFGLGGAGSASWRVGPGEWGITARPNIKGHLLKVFEDSWALANAGHGSAGGRLWLSKAKPLPDASWMPAWSAFNAALLFRWEDNFKSADAAYQKAASLSHAIGPFAQSRILNSWGGLFCSKGDMEDAQKHFNESASLYSSEDKDSLSEAYYASDLARILVVKNKWEEAIDLHKNALSLRSRLAPESPEVTESLIDLGLLEINRDNPSVAFEYFQRALALRKSPFVLDDDQATLLFGLGRVALEQGDLVTAEKHFEEVLPVWRSSPEFHSLILAGTLTALAEVAFYRDDMSRARTLYSQALQIFRRYSPGQDVAVAVSLCNLGTVALSRNRIDESISYYRQCVPTIEKLGPDDPNFSNFLNKYAEALLNKGALRPARAKLLQASASEKKMSLMTPTRAHTLMDLARLSVLSRKLKIADAYYSDALQIWRTTSPGSADEAETFIGMAEIARLFGETELATQYYGQGVLSLESQVAKLGGTAGTLANYRATHAQYYRAYIDLLVQQRKLNDAFQVLERSRARTLLETLSAATVDIHQGADPELLKRERALQSEIKAKSDRRVHMLTQQHTPEQTKALESEIADLTRQYDEVEEKLRSSSPNYAALTQPKPLTMEEIQKQLLDNDTVLVEYSLGEKRSYAFVVTPDSLTAHELPSRLKIEQAARRLHRLLKSAGSSPAQVSAAPPASANSANSTSANATSKAAQAQAIPQETKRTAALLSRMVLDPIAGEIGSKRLLIVADGALHYIPFTALPEPAAAHSASSNRPPLIVNHEVILLPSASVLAVLRKQQERKAAPAAEVAVLADPVFDKADTRVLEGQRKMPRDRMEAKSKNATAPIESAKSMSMYDLATPPLTRSLVDVGLGRGAAYHLPRLRYTRREAEAIYAEVPPGSAMKALDFEANRATATSPELSRYRIVHFATHGLLNSEHPELSGLVLSLVDRNGRPQDGFLGLQDIYNLNLPADLVVLSACETGLGKEISGEGLVGLTRGFMYAGASRVVASLWKVSDAATARLMAEFYRSMEQDHLAPAAALRQAQISMWKQKRWNDPYYWAAFQIQGEWK